jgi:GAF domain-containing protein
MAAISVLTRAGGHFKAAIGIAGGKRSTDVFATWALSQPTTILVVEDAAKDPEMQKALSETSLASIRFFAAVPLTLSSGEAIGALCVMGDTPSQGAARRAGEAEVPWRPGDPYPRGTAAKRVGPLTSARTRNCFEASK